MLSKKIVKLEQSIQAIQKKESLAYCPSCGSLNVTGDGALLKVNPRAMICKHCGNRDINFPERILKQMRGKK